VEGFILLFKYKTAFLQQWHSSSAKYESAPVEPSFIFTRQMINNSCATVAILNLILNSTQDLGDLSPVKQFLQGIGSAEMRGLALENIPAIKNSHNSFHFNSLYQSSKRKSSQEDPYHFISFVVFRGAL